MKFRPTIKYISLQRYAVALSVVLVAAFYTNLDLYNYVTGFPYPVAPKYVMLSLGVLSLPVIWRRVRQGRVHFDDKFLMFVVVAAFIFFAGLVVDFDAANLDLFEVQLSALLLLLLCYLVFRDSSALLAARYTVLVFLIFAVLVSLLEVAYPAIGTFPGRAAGLYLNPNINAFALNTGLVLTIGLLPARMRVMLLIVVGAAVLGTLSRSGMIIWSVIAIVLWLQGTLRAERKRAAVLAHILILLGFTLFFGYAYATVPQFRFFADAQTGSLTKVVIGNVTSPKDYDREVSDMAPPDVRSGGISEAEVKEVGKAIGAQDSSAERVWRLQQGLSLYRENPIWGIGMERAWNLSVHNSYLLYGLAYGLVGWMLVPALALVIMLSGDRHVTLPMALFLLLAAVFSHNLLVDRTVLLPLALAAAVAPETPPRHKALLPVTTAHWRRRSNAS